MSNCPYCNTILKASANYCKQCGKPNQAGIRKCGFCGGVMSHKAKFCISCGRTATTAQELAAKRLDGSLCPTCNSPLRPNAKFCIYCGNQIGVAAIPPITAAPSIPVAPAAVPPVVAPASVAPATTQSFATEVPKKKFPTKIVAIAGGALALAGAVVAAVLLLGQGSEIDKYFQKKFDYKILVDSRDKKEYRTIQIGNQLWLAQNLNANTLNSTCDSCSVYGRFYSFDEAQGACPEGFTLPTVSDFKKLQTYDAAALKSLVGWDAENPGSDEVGFASIPAGFYSYKEGVVKRRGETSGFWTRVGDGKLGVRMKIEKNGLPGSLNALDGRYGFSVRCISAGTSFWTDEDDIILDGRSESFYKPISIGSQKWLDRNVNVKLSKSSCDESQKDNCMANGRLYEWSAAVNACPAGTRLPNARDLGVLKSSLDGQPDLVNLFMGEYVGDKMSFWTTSEIYSNVKIGSLEKETSRLTEDKAAKKTPMSVRCIVDTLSNMVSFGTISDPRDNRSYKVVNVGDQTWMAENLRFDGDGFLETFCYDNDPANCEIYGRLYLHSDAESVCPAGFRLPNDNDFMALKKFIADNGNEKAGTLLKGTDKWTNPGVDLFGMNILPSGYRKYDGSYGRLGETAYLWSASFKGIDSAYHWALTNDSEVFSKSLVYTENARAVRCVKRYFRPLNEVEKRVYTENH